LTYTSVAVILRVFAKDVGGHEMKEYQSLSHTRWDCKYHVVFIPKRRKKAIFGAVRKHLGEIFRELARHKEAEVVEGHLMLDHVHMCLSIPPKIAVANVVGYVKGKSAITIARKFMGRARNFTGEVFWARGYFVSTVGLDEDMVRAYIRHQGNEDERYDQMKLGV
jgi:putative transposase